MTILLYILGGIATIVILFFLAVFISVVRTHRRWDRELKEACDSLRPLSSSHRCDPVRNSGRNGYSRMNSKHILLTIAWGIGILIGVIGYYYPIFTTQSLVKQEVKTLCSHGEPGDAVDYWDVPLQYQAEETEDQTALVCVVTSAGRDNEFDTDDDIIKEDVNLNKSKLIGRWAGQKFRQRMSQSRKGSTRSPETMKKIVATKRANGAYIVSDETREKIRQARLGKKLSPETIAKRTATWKKNRAEKLKKLEANMKKTGVIKNWQFHTLSISPEKAKEVHPDFDRDVVQMFTGTVVDDPTGRWQPGFHMRSTIVLKYDEKTKVVETLNTMYTLQGERGDVYFDKDIGDAVLRIFY